MKKTPKPRHWVTHVATESLEIPEGTFASNDSLHIAKTVKEAAEKSTRRKATPFSSAMSYLCFYLNRGGKNIPRKRRRAVERAKKNLRALFGREV